MDETIRTKTMEYHLTLIDGIQKERININSKYENATSTKTRKENNRPRPKMGF